MAGEFHVACSWISPSETSKLILDTLTLATDLNQIIQVSLFLSIEKVTGANISIGGGSQIHELGTAD